MLAIAEEPLPDKTLAASVWGRGAFFLSYRVWTGGSFKESIISLTGRIANGILADLS